MDDPSTIRGVIFDLDGVLVSTDELHYRAWKEMADHEDIPFDRNVNHRLRGVSRMESLEIILERADKSYSDEQKRELASQKNDRYRALLRHLSPRDLMPGAKQLLSDLRSRGLKVAVASSSRNASLIIDRLALLPLIDAQADGHEITHTKPDPEIFLLAAQRLGLAPAECLVVEDAASGIRAARRAGMFVFALGTQESLAGLPADAESLAQVAVDSLLRVANHHRFDTES